MVDFAGRPGPSPVLAGLYAAGVIDPRQRVLDVGCGDGTDVVALASWGFERVVGIDRDEDAVERARRRARRAGVEERVTLLAGSATRRHPALEPGSFDVLLDTLVWNNVHVASPAATPHYVRRAWELLAPHGLLLLQVRSDAPRGSALEPERELSPVFARYFSHLRAVAADIPEYRRGRGGRKAKAFARVVVAAGWRRERPLRAGNRVVGKA